MRQLIRLFLLTLVAVSCGSADRQFKIDGRFLNLNQGELYVYSPDGGIDDVDTMHVRGGRFSYTANISRPTTLMMVFPNFTEYPVFAEPGEKAKVRGDARHLKEMTVTGTHDNEQMTQFRKATATTSGDGTTAKVEEFVKGNPESAVSVYLVMKYFVQTPNPDHTTALQLMSLMVERQGKNAYLRRMMRHLDGLGTEAVSDSMPSFKALTTAGDTVTDRLLTDKATAVVVAYGSWNNESVNMLRQVCQMQRKSGGAFAVMGVCTDAEIKECNNMLRRQSINAPVVCDQDMIEGELYRRLGFSRTPDNMLIKNGRITARGLTLDEIKEELEPYLPADEIKKKSSKKRRDKK